MRKTIILFCLFLFSLNNLFAQNDKLNTQVTGVVIDQNKEPMIGVTVKVKGENVGVTTDFEGKYMLKVPEKSILTFSYIGFQTVEVPVKRAVHNIEMEEIINELDDVVVIGYGSMQKRDLSGAISSVDSKTIESQVPVNVFDAIQGQIAGVEIITASGAPGDESIVRVRGTSTFEAGANPLFVVDGVISESIDDINPNDIESIEVLKDAASAAIYGSRSANGVFLITTKQGESEMKLNLRYAASMSQLSRKMPVATGAERRYYEQVKGTLSRERLDVAASGAVTDSLRHLYNQNNDLQDLIFRSAMRHDINLSASGASQNNNFSYYLQAGLMKQQGIIVNSGYDRLSFRTNVKFNPNRRVSLNTSVYAGYGDKMGISESGVLTQLLARVPYWAIFNADGSYVPLVSGRQNPYAVAMTDTDKTQTYKTTLSQTFKYSFNKELSFSSRLRVVADLTRYQWYRPREQLNTSAITTGKDETIFRYDWSNENFASYQTTFNDDHRVNAMVGMSIQAWHDEFINLAGLNYTSEAIYTLNAASGYDMKNTYTRFSEHRMASFFGRVGYNYQSRYIFNANLRYDGSSRFGVDHRWGAFPSVSAAWRLSAENFNSWMKPFVSDAKLRVSYGVTGNENIGDYSSLLLYTPDYIYKYQGSDIAGIGASNLGYESLSWEETAQFNVGLDLRVLQGRVSIVADYYRKETDKLLNRVQLPKETGFNTMYRNVGSILNEGLELSVTWNIIRNRRVRWSVSANIATNDSRILKLADGIPFYQGTDQAIYIQEGERLGEFYGYKYINIYSYDESNAYSDDWTQLTPHFNSEGDFTHYSLGDVEYTGEIKQMYAANGDLLRGGDVNYQDTNKDGQITSEDRTVIGSALPDFFGGVSTSISYKRFTLSASLNFSIGSDIYNQAEAKRNQSRFDASTPSPNVINNMWTKPGDIATYPVPINLEHNMLVPSSLYIEDGSYVKLKSVNIGYDVPSKFVKKLKLTSAMISVYGKNLLTFTNYTGYDPEFGVGSNPLSMNIDTNRYPKKREYGININVGF